MASTPSAISIPAAVAPLVIWESPSSPDLVSTVPPAAATAPVPWAQRLGYLLEHIDAGKKASALKAYVQEHARLATVLSPTAPRMDSRRDDNWNLYVNADVEAET